MYVYRQPSMYRVGYYSKFHASTMGVYVSFTHKDGTTIYTYEQAGLGRCSCRSRLWRPFLLCSYVKTQAHPKVFLHTLS